MPAAESTAAAGRDFTLLWLASMISSLGDGVRLTAAPLLAALLTRDPGAVAFVTAAGFMPALLFGLLSGVVVDRVDRRRLMFLLDLGRAAVVATLALAVVNNQMTVPLLAALSFALGVGTTFFENAASAAVPRVVAKPELERANTRLFAVQTVSGQFLGLPLGGLLFAVAPAVPFAVDAASFAVAGALILAIRNLGGPPSRGIVKRSRLRTDLVEGVLWLWRHRLLRLLCGMLAVVNLAFGAAIGVLVLFAQDVLELSARGYGFLLTALAAGTLVGLAAVRALHRASGTAPTLTGVLLGQALAMAILGLTSSAIVAAAALALLGATQSLWNVVTVTIRQSAVPDGLLGRVTSAYRVVGVGAVPVGSVTGGLIARGYGLPAPFLAGAALLATTALLALPALVRLTPEVEGEAA